MTHHFLKENGIFIFLKIKFALFILWVDIRGQKLQQATEYEWKEANNYCKPFPQNLYKLKGKLQRQREKNHLLLYTQVDVPSGWNKLHIGISILT